MSHNWCEHAEKSSRYTLVRYRFDGGEVLLRVQSWVCPECGVHGAESEIVPASPAGGDNQKAAG